MNREEDALKAFLKVLPKMRGRTISEEWHKGGNVRRRLLLEFNRGLFKTLDIMAEYEKEDPAKEDIFGSGKLTRPVPDLEIGDSYALRHAVKMTNLASFPSIDRRKLVEGKYGPNTSAKMTLVHPRYYGDPVWIDFLRDQFVDDYSICGTIAAKLRLILSKTSIEFEMPRYSRSQYLDVLRTAFFLSNIHLLPEAYFKVGFDSETSYKVERDIMKDIPESKIGLSPYVDVPLTALFTWGLAYQATLPLPEVAFLVVVVPMVEGYLLRNYLTRRFKNREYKYG